MRIFDISVTIKPGIATWENGETSIAAEWLCRIDCGGPCNLSRITLGSHCGTHVDAPLHFLARGASVDQIPLDALIGPCCVVETFGAPDAPITAADCEAAGLAQGVERVLFKTANSRRRLLRSPEFHTDFAALAPDAALWLAQRGVRTVGIDYLSIGPYESVLGMQTHTILLEAGIAVLEGLSLEDVPPGGYRLIALPLNISGAEACPIRAVLIEE